MPRKDALTLFNIIIFSVGFHFSYYSGYFILHIICCSTANHKMSSATIQLIRKQHRASSFKKSPAIHHTIKRADKNFPIGCCKGFKFMIAYGFVEKIEPLAISALLFIFRMSLTHSAKSSGCSTLSGLPSVNPPWMDMSDAMVLGVSVITRMLCFLHSAIIDCDKETTAAFDAA